MGSCYARRDGDLITIGNELIERRWRLAGGALIAVGLRDQVHGQEWIAAGDKPSTVPAAWTGGEVVDWSVVEDRALPVEAPSLRAELRLRGERELRYGFKIFAGVPAIELQVLGDPVAVTAVDRGRRAGPSGVEEDPVPVRQPEAQQDLCEAWRLAPYHVDLVAVALQDRTDHHDNLATETRRSGSPVERIQLRGIAFGLEDPLSGHGLCLIKQAPLPDVRPLRDPIDLQLHGRDLQLRGLGAGDSGEGYPWTVLCYSGGAVGRARVLHAWQRCLRQARSGLDGVFLSNTWGDRNRDGRISETFLIEEVAASAQLGVEVQQIDDGWQRGTTSNSVNREQGGVWLGFWAADPEFWQPHPQRLPQGLEPVVEACREHGVGLGLWFAPDSADDFANHARDAAVIVDYHRRHGVNWVKIDGVKAHSKTAERNLRRFFHQVLRETDGGVVFDLDVTAEVRPGYFGRPEIGPLFVENRYTDWGRYFPHATLRNLWQLAWWIDPPRLRMELLNTARNRQHYGEDPLAPACYRSDYLFASVMVASPLGWFETSQLPADQVAAIADLVTIWKQYRPELHGGSILPIGDCPSGGSWTGFCVDGGDHAHLLVFREHSRDSDCALDIPLEGDWVDERLAGSGELALTHGVAEIDIAEPLRFGWWRLRRSGSASGGLSG